MNIIEWAIELRRMDTEIKSLKEWDSTADRMQTCYDNWLNLRPEREEVPELKGIPVLTLRSKDLYMCQAVYYAKCGDKYAVDFNGTHTMLVDYIVPIKPLTKKEAKQRVSEMFGNNNKVTSQQIRDIIDLIE
jgi:hypothetical protein